MAVLGAILVLLVVHADAVSVKSSFKVLKPADSEKRTGGTRITSGLLTALPASTSAVGP